MPDSKQDIKVFKGIGQLITLSTAAHRKGRQATATDLIGIPNAALVSVGGKIAWLGPEKELPKRYVAKSAKNLKGAVVIPGLIECHTHSIYAGNRAGEFERRNQGESYQSIAKSGGGILSTVKATRAASEKDLAKSAQKRIDRFVKQGVTTVEVKSGYGLTFKDEMKMLQAARRLKRARIVPTFLGAHAVPKEFASADAYVDELITYLPKISKVASRVDAFVENGYFSVATTRRYLKAAAALGMTASIHADQLTLSGGSKLAVELKISSADHLVQLSSKEIRELASSDVTCVLLPSSDLYMKMDYPKAREMIDAGAIIALATDFNPGTSPSQDVALVGMLARVQMKMTFAETLVAYTVGAAHALGLEREIGSLEIGKSCDFSVLSGGLEELFLDVGHMPISKTYLRGHETT